MADTRYLVRLCEYREDGTVRLIRDGFTGTQYTRAADARRDAVDSVYAKGPGSFAEIVRIQVLSTIRHIDL